MFRFKDDLVLNETSVIDPASIPHRSPVSVMGTETPSQQPWMPEGTNGTPQRGITDAFQVRKISLYKKSVYFFIVFQNVWSHIIIPVCTITVIVDNEDPTLHPVFFILRIKALIKVPRLSFLSCTAVLCQCCAFSPEPFVTNTG